MATGAVKSYCVQPVSDTSSLYQDVKVHLLPSCIPLSVTLCVSLSGTHADLLPLDSHQVLPLMYH